MKTIRVWFSNGDSITTNINGSDDDIRAYYLGKVFNLGAENDLLVKCVSIEVLA